MAEGRKVGDFSGNEETVPTMSFKKPVTLTRNSRLRGAKSLSLGVDQSI